MPFRGHVDVEARALGEHEAVRDHADDSDSDRRLDDRSFASPKPHPTQEDGGQHVQLEILPETASPENGLAVIRTPPTAAVSPVSRNTSRVICRTRIPARSAESGFPPAA